MAYKTRLKEAFLEELYWTVIKTEVGGAPGRVDREDGRRDGGCCVKEDEMKTADRRRLLYLHTLTCVLINQESEYSFIVPPHTGMQTFKLSRRL